MSSTKLSPSQREGISRANLRVPNHAMHLGESNGVSSLGNRRLPDCIFYAVCTKVCVQHTKLFRASERMANTLQSGAGFGFRMFLVGLGLAQIY